MGCLPIQSAPILAGIPAELCGCSPLPPAGVLFLICAADYTHLTKGGIHWFQFLYYFSSFWGGWGWGGRRRCAVALLRCRSALVHRLPA